jgi:hypothetical protein
MAYFKLAPKALRRDQMRCKACGTSARPTLTVHHVVPVELRGHDTLSNLTTLCANCHRIVHWLATGDRSLEAHAYGLGQSATHRRRLLALARRIRRHRLRLIRPGGSPADSLKMAMNAVTQRNGLDRTEAALFSRCFNRALRAMAPKDRKECSVRRVRESRFISVNAKNHLVLRGPAWNDRRKRIEGDIILIWPQAVRPSVLSPSRFSRESSGRFKLIPCFNLSLTWDECLALSKHDWKVFRKACHDALEPHTRRWRSNVIL